jgi:hypothetical protein
MTYDNPNLEFLIDQERGRCAQLVEGMIGVYEYQRKRNALAPKRVQRETAADFYDTTIQTLKMLKRCIETGYDPREDERRIRENEKVQLMQLTQTEGELAELYRRIDEQTG